MACLHIEGKVYLVFSNNNVEIVNINGVTDISCGERQLACITKNDVCPFGVNVNPNNVILYGILVIKLNEKIIYITCGINHIACITETRNLYMWGKNNYGQLGIGTLVDTNIPKLVTLPDGGNVAVSNNLWTKERHKLASPGMKKIMITMLILNLKKYQEGYVCRLPKDMMMEIFQWLDLE